ncbi:hypothetical protein ACFL2C_03260 [Patescibacteria group bacterium]
MKKESSQKGIALVMIIVGVVLIGAIGYAGVKSGVLRQSAAPSNDGSPVNSHDQLPENPSTPTPEPGGWGFENLETSGGEVSDGFSDTDSEEITWENYSNDEYGYSLKHPTDWSVENVPATDHREIRVKHPDGAGFVLISAYMDESLGSELSLEEAIALRTSGLKESANVTSYDDSVQGSTGGYMAVGTKDYGGTTLEFQERGLFGTSGKILLFHGAVTPAYPQKDVITQIIESFVIE